MPTRAAILLVEDDENDIFFVELAVREIGIRNPLRVVRDGAKAIQYLKGEGESADRKQFPQARLVLLDISMPIASGFQVLEWLRQQPWADELVAVVLSASTDPADIERATALGAAEYQVKPSNALHLTSILRELTRRWLNHSP